MSPAAREELYLLAGEYLLGVLDEAAAREFETRLEREPVLRDAVAYWEERLRGLAGTLPEVTPSPALWMRIAASTAGPAPRAARESTRPRGRWWERVGIVRAVAGAAFAAALVMIILAPDPPLPPPPYAVVLQSTADRGVAWIARTEADGRLLFVPVMRSEVPAGRSLQLWARADDPQGPVSLGLVPADRPFRIGPVPMPPLAAGQLFAISLEPAGGSPVDKPTGPVLFAGRVVTLE